MAKSKKIIRVDEKGGISFVSIPNENETTQKQFILNNEGKGYILTDFDFKNGKVYTYQNGKIVEDVALNELFEKRAIKSKRLSILKNTDFLMLVDNPAKLSKKELEMLKDYREKIRTVKNKVEEPSKELFSKIGEWLK